MNIRPIEGIDKISFVLNPLFLNNDCVKKHIDPYNRLSVHKAGILQSTGNKAGVFKSFFRHSTANSLCRI